MMLEFKGLTTLIRYTFYRTAAKPTPYTKTSAVQAKIGRDKDLSIRR